MSALHGARRGGVSHAALARAEFTNQISVNQRMEDHEPETLVELVKHAATSRPDREALRFKQNKSWVSMTAKELLARVRNVALGLYQLGIHKSDRVAILAESGPL